jgi:hypothetical protein
LGLERFLGQVVEDEAVRAAEVLHKRPRIAMPLERNPRQLQTGGPPFGALG